jgi:hypothetical protein
MKIIKKKDINIILEDINKNNFATIFGKGPTFKILEKEKNEFRICINQSSNLSPDVDMIAINDLHNIYKIHDCVYNKLKYLLIPEYLHKEKTGREKEYYSIILKYLQDKFFGNLIIYNLKTTKQKNEELIDLFSVSSSGNTAVDFICEQTKIKKIELYGIAVEGDNYHSEFIGNGYYKKNLIRFMKNYINFICEKYNVTYKLN